MGVTAALARFATTRPHLLVVEAAGGAAARLRVERLARQGGWALVDTPADADVLIVCGPAGGSPSMSLMSCPACGSLAGAASSPGSMSLMPPMSWPVMSSMSMSMSMSPIGGGAAGGR